MSPEPLKGKLQWTMSPESLKAFLGLYGVIDKSIVLIKKDDVHSAVEWLKCQIPNIVIDLISEDEKRIMDKIDEAFEDVMKKAIE